MNSYITKKGNNLIVEKVESDTFKGVPKYIFTLHQKRGNGGENIIILQSAYLTTPDYFTKKYIEEN